MALNGFFSASVLGMRSQALALELIGTNVANVNTGGYRRQDTQFATVLSDNIGGSTDNGGTLPNVFKRITHQGQLISSPRGLDLAISGQGFFVTNTQLDLGGEQLYTRDGSFNLVTGDSITLTDSETGQTFESSESYIVDKNGNYLLGFAADANGDFPTTGTLTALRVDQNAFATTGRATTQAELVLNLPSNGDTISNHLTAVNNLNTGGLAPDGMETYVIDFVDSLGNTKTARLNFTKSSANNWELSATYAGAPVAQVDTVTIAGTPELNDQYTIQVDNFNATYLVQTGDTLADVVTGLVNAVNNNTLTANIVTAAAGATAGTITLTADTSGTAFTGAASATNGGATADNTASIATTTANDRGLINSSVTQLPFTGSGIAGTPDTSNPGAIIAPSAINYSFSFPASGSTAASTATFALDIDGITQFAAPFQPRFYDANGFAAAELQSVSFDSEGHVVGLFANGTGTRLYKLPLAQFDNANGLEMLNGMTFRESPESGTATIQTVDATGAATFVASTHEISNVHLEDEFTKMIQTQQTYNAVANAFRTQDEMLELIRDMKR